MLQTQSQHVFSHQHQYPQSESAWLQHAHQQPHPSHYQQQQPQQQQQHPSSLTAQHHAQAQAQAAAAAAVAQQQHYNRIALNNNTSNNSPSTSATDSTAVGVGGMDGGISDENRKVLTWVAELLDPQRREGALMELSKKREQVPELALIIWHSFGMSKYMYILDDYTFSFPPFADFAFSTPRCNGIFATGNHIRIPAFEPVAVDGRSFQ